MTACFIHFPKYSPAGILQDGSQARAKPIPPFLKGAGGFQYLDLPEKLGNESFIAYTFSDPDYYYVFQNPPQSPFRKGGVFDFDLYLL